MAHHINVEPGVPWRGRLPRRLRLYSLPRPDDLFVTGKTVAYKVCEGLPPDANFHEVVYPMPSATGHFQYADRVGHLYSSPAFAPNDAGGNIPNADVVLWALPWEAALEALRQADAALVDAEDRDRDLQAAESNAAARQSIAAVFRQLPPEEGS